MSPLRRSLFSNVFNGPNLAKVASWHARPKGLASLLRRMAT